MFDRGRQKNKAGTMPDNLRTSVSGRICCFHCPPREGIRNQHVFLFGNRLLTEYCSATVGRDLL